MCAAVVKDLVIRWCGGWEGAVNQRRSRGIGISRGTRRGNWTGPFITSFRRPRRALTNHVSLVNSFPLQHVSPQVLHTCNSGEGPEMRVREAQRPLNSKNCCIHQCLQEYALQAPRLSLVMTHNRLWRVRLFQMLHLFIRQTLTPDFASFLYSVEIAEANNRYCTSLNDPN